MKKISLIVLMVVIATGVSAQLKNSHYTKSNQRKSSRYEEETELPKHVVYADVGFCGGFYFGASATYNYKLLPWLGVGIGVQDYDFYPTVTATDQYVPAVYGDLQFYIRPKKKGQFLAFIDIGKDFYESSEEYARKGDYIYYVPGKNGPYFGMGLGYFRAVTKRGWGPYTTLKMIGNNYPLNKHIISTGKSYTTAYYSGSFVLSVGFRF